MKDTEASYRTYWASLTDRSEREVYVPFDIRDNPPSDQDSLAVGDRIRILQGGLDCAMVKKGDVLTVLDISHRSFETNAPTLRRGGTWEFGLDDEGIGWERA